MKVEIKGKTYKGSVTIYDRLYLSQVELIEEAFKPLPDGDRVLLTHIDKPRIPAILACVEKWEVENLPADMTLETFPLTPRREVHDLIDKLFLAIAKVYNGELEIPNE